MIEPHVAEEMSRQLDYYVDAYRRYDSISRRTAAMSEQLAALESDLFEAERMREHAADAFNGLISDITDDDDVAAVEAMVSSKLGGIVDSMVVV